MEKIRAASHSRGMPLAIQVYNMQNEPIELEQEEDENEAPEEGDVEGGQNEDVYDHDEGIPRLRTRYRQDPGRNPYVWDYTESTWSLYRPAETRSH
jgi:hypothetical protein